MTAPDHTLKPFKNHLHQRGHPYMHKSAEGRSSPFLRQTYPATSVTGVPSAVKPFRTETRTWNSAT
jgi:hypothetical protein